MGGRGVCVGVADGGSVGARAVRVNIMDTPWAMFVARSSTYGVALGAHAVLMRITTSPMIAERINRRLISPPIEGKIWIEDEPYSTL